MKSQTAFTCPTLQKIDSDAESVVANHLQGLDELSNNIKAMGISLEKAAIPFTFIYVLSSSENRYTEERVRPGGFPTLYHYMNVIETTESCLVWGKTETGNYKLTHTVYISKNDVIGQQEHDGKMLETLDRPITKTFSCTPLLETKSHFRLKIEKDLPVFYRKIFQALKNKSTKEIVVEYSPTNFIFPAKVDPDQNRLPF